ncbi:hypothetical protein AWC38_SpisGene15085 [Stylophora pistillata]|uniref:Uncharacterized protein n=1 Tax=Stylophora pistillata TaxID=50429 RepID=A0A2B4RW72_STYPI|nr:hypothetical protein AWC38_SpisGene15085 [Stylophora pistillata]
MGNFHSMICANRKNIGVEETDKEQIEETPMVKIHLKCPSNKGSSHSQQELSQDIDTAEAVESCSVEALDIVSYSGSDDEWSSDSLSSQSEDECDTPSAAEDQSQWQWMYSKLLKPREQLANESLKKKQLKKKEVHREDGTRAPNGPLMEKKIRKSVKSKVAEDSKSGPRCHGSPSSSSTASVIHKTSPTTNNDYTNGRSRKFFRGRINKVAPI